MDDELLTTREVAEMLKVDERTVWTYRNLEVDPLPYIKLGIIRYRKSDVLEWLKRRENASKSAEKQAMASD